tara:strand:+ start:8019 stop:8231 length:213 start_codon:yes stop_codon:yes gene_type:complete
MIGPQAYENLFQTKHEPMKKYEVQHEGKTYVYSYDWEIIEMHEGMTAFKEWCIEDAVERQGEYAEEDEQE